MPGTPANSTRAAQALDLLTALQSLLANALAHLDLGPPPFQPIEWLRDAGRHGGGTRLVAPPKGIFNRASVNISQVHYDDLPDKKLASATALSTIVHPAHPCAPSMHMHISWTELRASPGYWRLMADLNPAIPVDTDRDQFLSAMRDVSGDNFDTAIVEGDRYFSIPVLQRSRGVAHFYLEGYRGSSPEADREFATGFGEAVITAYTNILDTTLATAAPPTAEQQAAQQAYHTLYLFQVLTLDRGTTSGLLVHDQNDVGILGSLPAQVDKALLASWVARMPAPQGELLSAIIVALAGESDTVEVDESAKRRLAAAVRAHYRTHPQALAMQARGQVLPPTVANHR